MKRALVILASFLVMAVAAIPAHAVPSLGVATNVAYVGSTGQTGLEPYQNYFVNTFIPGTDAQHGFVVGASGSNLIVFGNWVNTPVYLLWTSVIEAANNPEINGVGGTPLGSIGQFDGYKPAEYYGVSLGFLNINGAPLPSPPFSPDNGNGKGNSQAFYSITLPLTYSGSVASGQYFFAVADATDPGLWGNAQRGHDYDPFSPKTTSATGAPVPEPGTFLLLGSGLVGLAGWGRKKLRK